MAKSLDLAKIWFSARDWKPFAFQKQVWAAIKNGESGLLHASTGAGKTYAVWFAALNRFAKTLPVDAPPRKRKQPAEPLTVLWITPMRALAAATLRALQEAAPDWQVEARTGDTSSAQRARRAADRRFAEIDARVDAVERRFDQAKWMVITAVGLIQLVWGIFGPAILRGLGLGG